jgi:hypothetical protein
MKLISTTLALFVSAALATSVSYDPTYDQSSGLLSSTACSNGPNGLIGKGYSTLGSLPDFPYIGGSSDNASLGQSIVYVFNWLKKIDRLMLNDIRWFLL